MERTKILIRRGVELLIRYEHEEAEPQTRDYPGRGENVEIIKIQLLTPEADISDLLEEKVVEDIMSTLIELDYVSNQEERLERSR